MSVTVVILEIVTLHKCLQACTMLIGIPMHYYTDLKKEDCWKSLTFPTTKPFPSVQFMNTFLTEM